MRLRFSPVEQLVQTGGNAGRGAVFKLLGDHTVREHVDIGAWEEIR